MERPLEGIRVLDFSKNLAGPMCAQLLADFGAEVIKIEDIGGETGRWYPPLMGPYSAAFYPVNRDKGSVALNLRSEEGREIFKKLVADADVLLDQFRPGVAAKMGLDYETLRKVNPRLIYCSLTGYGLTGPLKEKAGHDINFAGLAGVLELTGTKGGPPAISAVQIAGVAGGTLYAVIAILLALKSREQTGEGQLCEVSMVDGAINLLVHTMANWSVMGVLPERGSDILTGGFACYNVYRTSDDRWMALGAVEFKFWSEFCKHIGLPELIELQWYPEKQPELIEAISRVIAGKTQQEWTEEFEGVDTCFTPVLNFQQVYEHPHMRTRESVIRLENFMNSGQDLYMPGLPVRLWSTPGQMGTRIARTGESTRELLLRAGYTVEEIEELRQKRVIDWEE